MPDLMQRAIVAGGSMAGLLAARVLADHYAEVILIERDTFPSFGEPRKGVPQARHAHAVLAQGSRLLEGFFPGISSGLIGQGALLADALADCRRFIGGGYYCAHGGLPASSGRDGAGGRPLDRDLDRIWGPTAADRHHGLRRVRSGSSHRRGSPADRSGGADRRADSS
jgi:hypothetical protein